MLLRTVRQVRDHVVAHNRKAAIRSVDYPRVRTVIHKSFIAYVGIQAVKWRVHGLKDIIGQTTQCLAGSLDPQSRHDLVTALAPKGSIVEAIGISAPKRFRA